MRAQVHNAKVAAHDSSDCWIASITNDDGRPTGKADDVEEHDSEGAAIKWAADRLALHGTHPAYIDLDDGRQVRPDLPSKQDLAARRRRT